MGINFKLDTKGLEAKMVNYGNSTKKQLAAELNIFGLNVVNDAKRNAPVDEGHLRNSIGLERATPQKLKVEIVVAANYAAYIEFGTRKYAAQYVASLPPDWQSYAAKFKGSAGGNMEDFVMRLVGWVHRKGIALGKDNYNAAYRIALSIMRNGIKAQPFLYPSYAKHKIELINKLK